MLLDCFHKGLLISIVAGMLHVGCLWTHLAIVCCALYEILSRSVLSESSSLSGSNGHVDVRDTLHHSQSNVGCVMCASMLHAGRRLPNNVIVLCLCETLIFAAPGIMLHIKCEWTSLRVTARVLQYGWCCCAAHCSDCVCAGCRQ